MPVAKRDGSGVGGGGGRTDGRAQNGHRPNFRTDAAISNSRLGNERTLQPWVPDSSDALDGSLEKSSGGGHWDQFAENERLFGIKSDYDENIYTTAINKSHPQYRERIAAAEKKAREIERSVAATAHVAEERVMDYVAGSDQGGDNEEDKYSGVRRQDQLSSGGRENKYTPPAKRAPVGQSTVKGAPVDPAIISSQIKVSGKKQQSSTQDDGKPRPAEPVKNGVTPKADASKATSSKATDEKTVNVKGPASASASPADPKLTEKATTPTRSSASTGRNASPQVNESTPSATSTVERDVLKEFKNFASQQRENAQKVRSNKAKADKATKLTELRQFADSFKLTTPVPSDLVSIIAKDPAKQKEIQAKALKNAEDVTKPKADGVPKDKPAVPVKEAAVKPAEPSSTKTNPEAKPSRGPNAPHGPPHAGGPNRHGGRQQYGNQPPYNHQPYRNNRGGAQHAQQPGHLAQRLRNVEQQKFSTPPVHAVTGQDGRVPPTGPSENNFNRRYSAVPTHMGAKLNPNSHEFRPSPFAASFNPNSHASASSSPRSASNNVPEPPAAPGASQMIRRKTKAVDVKKCYILSHIKTITPPQGRNWDDNGGLRPSYDTLPTWRQLQNDEKADSTMHLTYKEYFERQPFAGSTMNTPNPQHIAPNIPHQHQLPFHLQPGGQHLGPRQSPHLQHMQMHNGQHGPGPHQGYNHDDHRMMQSNSAQSFASPRLVQAGVAYPGMSSSPAQMSYNQPVFMGPGTPQMGQYRSFSNNPQYMPHQQGQMGGPMMMQPQFMPGPQGMVSPHMVYGGGHPHFMPPGGPPQPGPGANGYPSPGRAQAPMMAHQGSQQGQQPMYGMSPNVQYSQPYGPGQPGGPMSNPRGYNHAGPQHLGTSPQQTPQFGPHQQRSGSNNYNKNLSAQSPRQPQRSLGSPSSGVNRTTGSSDEAK